MLYFILSDDGEVQGTTTSLTEEQRRNYNKYAYRGDFKSLEDAQKIAESASNVTERLHMAIDNGNYCSPRYDVVEAPLVGDMVSYAFNGDYYPDSEIVKISKSYRRIETASGNVYWRYKETGSWKLQGTWIMVKGTHDERNPCF